MVRIAEFYPERQGRPYAPPVPPFPAAVKGIHLAGEFSKINKTDDYTAGDEMVILVDGNVTITLPSAATNSSKVYWIKNIGSTGVVTVKGDKSDETIDGGVSVDLTLQYQYAMIIGDGSVWHILGGAYVRLEEILKAQETLMERLAKQLKNILRCLSSMSGLNIDEED